MFRNLGKGQFEKVSESLVPYIHAAHSRPRAGHRRFNVEHMIVDTLQYMLDGY